MDPTPRTLIRQAAFEVPSPTPPKRTTRSSDVKQTATAADPTPRALIRGAIAQLPVATPIPVVHTPAMMSPAIEMPSPASEIPSPAVEMSSLATSQIHELNRSVVSEHSMPPPRARPPRPTRVIGGVAAKRISKPASKQIVPTSLLKYVLMISTSNSNKSRPFASFARLKVSKDAREAVAKLSERFFDQVSGDLAALATHARRNSIDPADATILLKRQRLLPRKKDLVDLVRSYLPQEAVEQVATEAQAANAPSNQKRNKSLRKK